MYFFFGAVSACAVVFVWFLVSETKSVPLDQMDRLFEIKPVRGAQPRLMDELATTNAEFAKLDRKDEDVAQQVEKR